MEEAIGLATGRLSNPTNPVRKSAADNSIIRRARDKLKIFNVYSMARQLGRALTLLLFPAHAVDLVRCNAVHPAFSKSIAAQSILFGLARSKARVALAFG